MTRLSTTLLLGLTALAASCTDEFNEPGRPPAAAIYSPSSGSIPVPNDLIYSGSTDGTLNIPVADPTDFSNPQVAINSLDGWSTSAPLTIAFGEAVDVTSVVPGTNLRIFEVTTLVTPTQPVGGPVTGVTAEYLDFTVVAATETPDGERLRILLEQPLKSATSYMVILTNSILGADGRPLARSGEFELAANLEPLVADHPFAPLQGLVGAMLASADTQGIARDDVSLAYSFTTQGVDNVLSTLYALALGQEAAVIAGLCAALPFGCDDLSSNPFTTPSLNMDLVSPGTVGDFIGGGPDLATVYTGSLTVPYYLESAENLSGTDVVVDTGPLDVPWQSRYPFTPLDTEGNLTRFNPLPNATSQETIPVLATMPTGAAPGNSGWPIVVFQHGITQERTNMLLIADRLTAEGLAVIAIDLPLHGLRLPTFLPLAGPLFSGYETGTTRERTFGLDLLDGDGLPGPDGTADTSGAHMINLANLAVSRDNLRQGVSDLFNLVSTLGSVDIINNGTGASGADGFPDFDTSSVHFVGHSLGGIVGITFAAFETRLQSATFAMPGGSIPYLLNESGSFMDQIQGGLAAVGILPGSAGFADYLNAAQAILDSADPVNYAATVGASDLPIHFIEVIGGGMGGGMPDAVVPNSTVASPLGGTDPLISLMGLPSVNMSQNDVNGVQAAVRFIEGNHASLLIGGFTPEFIAPFVEMQSQAAIFAASSGQTLTITDSSVIQ